MTGGITQDGLRYEWLRSPDEAPPMILSIPPKPRTHWTEEGAAQFVGQQLGVKWRERVHLVRIVAVRLNPLTRSLEVTCR